MTRLSLFCTRLSAKATRWSPILTVNILYAMPSYSTTINGKIHQVDIDEIHGAGAGTWHVLVDRLYQGAIVLKEGKLEFLPGPGCKLQGEEIAGLLDRLRNENDPLYSSPQE